MLDVFITSRVRRKIIVIYAKYPDFKTYSAGAGVGVRYNLGFAPIRADIGFPLNRRTGDAPFQIYLSIGQSF